MNSTVEQASTQLRPDHLSRTIPAGEAVFTRDPKIVAVCVRLFFTVALIYTIHFAPNVVRETYLAVALGDRLSIRVDPFLGLHPDIFEIAGRGAYINGNPGASMLGAIPYAIAHPALETLYRLQPSLVAAKAPTTYDDPRPNRTRFMNEMRARGLDVRLAIAAAVIHLGFNVPLGAFAAVVMWLFLRARLRNERAALWLALLFAFGTPVFFRSAFLNQNLVLAYCTLFAFLALIWRRADAALPPRRDGHRLFVAGALLGIGLVCDYSAIPLLVAFGFWVTLLGIKDEGVRGIRPGATFISGAAGPIAFLLAYQYAAFGNPLLPAQAYMPATELSLRGWHGVQLPIPALLWRNLFDPAYGLFAFCPMLVAAIFGPRYRRMPGGSTMEELALTYGASFALYVFSSSIAFAGLQWNTGVRYLVPAAPLLFLALAPVLIYLPRRLVLLVLVVPTVTVSWCVSMARESVGTSLLRVFTLGFELPWHSVLQKTASAYMPALSRGGSPLAILVLVGVVLWVIWTPRLAGSELDVT